MFGKLILSHWVLFGSRLLSLPGKILGLSSTDVGDGSVQAPSDMTLCWITMTSLTNHRKARKCSKKIIWSMCVNSPSFSSLAPSDCSTSIKFENMFVDKSTDWGSGEQSLVQKETPTVEVRSILTCSDWAWGQYVCCEIQMSAFKESCGYSLVNRTLPALDIRMNSIHSW